jgi:hypothetical protein
MREGFRRPALRQARCFDNFQGDLQGADWVTLHRALDMPCGYDLEGDMMNCILER